MTLVAVLKLRDRVHLACDCMLSAPGPMHRADRLPFAGEIKGSTSTNPEYNVSGVARKCVLIDDRKIILWSGDAIIASSIIKNVLNKIDAEHSLRQALEQEHHEYDKAERNKVFFFCVELRDFINQTTRVAASSIGKPAARMIFSLGEREDTAEQIGEIALAGSGAEKFLDLFRYFISHEANMPHIKKDKTGWTGANPLLVTAGYFCAWEYFRKTNINEMFGGGFEIIHITSTKEKSSFRMLDRIAFLYCIVTTEGSIVHFDFLNSYVYQWYENGNLYILNSDLNQKPDSENMITLIPYIHERWKTNDFRPNWEEWEAETVCCFFSVRPRNGGAGWAFAVLKPPEAIFRRTKDALTLELTGQAQEWMKKMADEVAAGKI
jgi:hypothetical protein